ncbi:MAG: hypothetical protein OXH50_06965 [Gemmatimonadetes bacterium]|nr:hypothetical protein [Gemmatimonadota bacterium]
MKFPSILLSAGILLLGREPVPAATGYAGEFLAVGAGARALALGGAGLTLVDDATARYRNPAAVAGLESSAHLVRSGRSGGLVSHDFAAVNVERFLLFDGFSVGILRLSVGDIPFTALPDPGAPPSADNRPLVSSTEVSSDYALYLSGGRRASERLDLGASVKVVYRSVASFSAHGAGLDLGARFRLTPEVAIAAVLRDATTSPISWNTGTSDRVRPSLLLAAAITRTVGRGQANLALGAAGGGDASSEAVPMLVGAEYDLGKLALRAGLQEERQAYGIGIRAHDMLRLDLAYQQHDLEATYVFSATTDF